jgi:DNA repair protein RadC
MMKTIRNYELKVKRVRLAEPHPAYGRSVHAPADIAGIAQAIIGDSAQEHFCVFLLDIKNRVIGYQEVARGGIDTCPIDPRVVFRAAVVTGAASIIVAHYVSWNIMSVLWPVPLCGHGGRLLGKTAFGAENSERRSHITR